MGRRSRKGLAWGVGAALLAMGLGACDSGEPDTSPMGGGTPTPEESTSLPGDLPAEALGADHVDWDEVGPGWFLVSWRSEPPVMIEADGVEWETPTVVSDRLYLIDPKGRFYLVASLEGRDVSRLQGWIEGDALLFRDKTPAPGGGWFGDMMALDLRTGETRTVMEDSFPIDGRVLDDGRIVSIFHGGDGSSHQLFDDYAPVAELCRGEVQGGDHFGPSPTGGYLVCLKGNWEDVVDPEVDSPTTDVIVSRLDPPYSADVVSEFRMSPREYQMNGWIEEDTFLVSRRDEAGNWVYFAYDVTARDIEDFTVPVPGASQGYVVFDHDSRTYDFLWSSGTFYSETGDVLASVGCPAGSVPGSSTHSGSRALVMCSSNEQQDLVNTWSGTFSLWMVDLENGGATMLFEADVELGYPSLVGEYGYNGIGHIGV